MTPLVSRSSSYKLSFIDRAIYREVETLNPSFSFLKVIAEFNFKNQLGEDEKFLIQPSVNKVLM